MQMENWKQWRSREKTPIPFEIWRNLHIRQLYIFGCSVFNWNPVGFRFRLPIHVIYVFGRERERETEKNWHHCPRSFLWPFYHFNRVRFFFNSLAAHEINVRARESQKKREIIEDSSHKFSFTGSECAFFFFIFITQNSSSSSWFRVKCTSQRSFDSEL